ncbi:MAG: penicillin-binding protein 1C [Pseudomonadota bacterium]
MSGVRRLSVAAIAFCVLIAAADLAFPPPLEHAGAVSPVALDRDGRWLHAFSTQEGRWRFAADPVAIDPLYLERLIAVEDQRFYRHAGVDPIAVGRAAWSSLKARRIVSGASTITMQVARLIEPRPRTLRSKIIEMARAVQIERRLSKEQTLALYLTLAPYGGNLEGVRAASLFYFGKEPSRLTDAEQALLIALPQAPEARRPDLRPEAAVAARSDILKRLERAGRITQERAAEAREAALPGSRREQPKLAWHAAHRLAHSANGPAHTSLDASLQARAEALVARHAAEFNDSATAALLIVDNASREVIAAVGSSSLDVAGGWIDLTRASRSPGSALKPFIYAAAFEDGRLGPQSLIDDAPRRFGDYSPENFDRAYRGEVRVKEALKYSLNLPAVAALKSVGVKRFFAELSGAGASLKLRSSADPTPGLALALGGAGVTAEDLAVLYAALANDGVAAPLQWSPCAAAATPPTRRLFSENTARRINAILVDAPAPAGRAPARLSEGAPRIAFKTGTSYGFRDAWAAGHNASTGGEGVTIVAWVGRADGASRPGVTGLKAAAPLLFDAFDLVREMRGAGGDGPADPDMDEGWAPVIAAGPRSPEIIFPRDGAELFVGERTRDFAFAARGGADDYRWYVDGTPVDENDGRALWRPESGGFFDVVVVDRAGQSSRAKVRVRLADRQPS